MERLQRYQVLVLNSWGKKQHFFIHEIQFNIISKTSLLRFQCTYPQFWGLFSSWVSSFVLVSCSSKLQCHFALFFEYAEQMHQVLPRFLSEDHHPESEMIFLWLQEGFQKQPWSKPSFAKTCLYMWVWHHLQPQQSSSQRSDHLYILKRQTGIITVNRRQYFKCRWGIILAFLDLLTPNSKHQQ